MIDEKTLIDNYLNGSNWKVKENANMIFSSGHLSSFVASESNKEYVLNNVIHEKGRQYHKIGKIHIHDLSSSRIAPYCSSFSTSEIIKKGLLAPKGRVLSTPPKHLISALNQLTNFIGIISQEFAGAVATNNFSLYLAPFVYYDKLDYKEVKQQIQQFIFHINQPSRWSEAPFSNVTLDLVVPEDLKDRNVIIGGVEKEKTYKEFEKEMNMINEAILDVMIEGDARGVPFTFPVITIGVSPSFPWESEISKKIFQVTAKYGTPFFENFYPNTGRDPSQGRSLCCRLKVSTTDVMKHVGGIFGSGDSMGSLSVVTINLNRLGYESRIEFEKLKKDEKVSKDEIFYKNLDDVLNVCKDILVERRAFINKLFDSGLFAYTKLYLKNYKTYFNTIGIIGGNECMLNYWGKGMSDKESVEFMKKVIDYINDKCLKFQKETGSLFNLEAVPGEGSATSLAKKDKKIYPDIIVAGEKSPYLTNSVLPSVKEGDFVKLIKDQEEIQAKFTGGTVLNIYLGEKLNSYVQAKNLVKKIVENTKIPYFSITPTYSICPDHNYIAGEHYNCPTCNKVCEIYSRVVGYLRPKNSYNEGKAEEFRQRKYYDISDIEKIGDTENEITGSEPTPEVQLESS